MKKHEHKFTRGLGLLGFVIIIIIVITFIKIIIKTNTSKPPTVFQNTTTKTYESKNLNFTVDVPNLFDVSDEQSRIMLNSGKGQIVIRRNGTQFSDLDGYLTNFDQKTNLILEQDEKMVINNYQSRLRSYKNTDTSNGSEKSYYIYIDYNIYILSTSSEALFDDLDQIAKSFRYTK